MSAGTSPCPSCKTEVADNLLTCPNCGAAKFVTSEPTTPGAAQGAFGSQGGAAGEETASKEDWRAFTSPEVGGFSESLVGQFAIPLLAVLICFVFGIPSRKMWRGFKAIPVAILVGFAAHKLVPKE